MAPDKFALKSRYKFLFFDRRIDVLQTPSKKTNNISTKEVRVCFGIIYGK